MQDDGRFAEMFVRGQWAVKSQAPAKIVYVSVSADAAGPGPGFQQLSCIMQQPGINMIEQGSASMWRAVSADGHEADRMYTACTSGTHLCCMLCFD